MECWHVIHSRLPSIRDSTILALYYWSNAEGVNLVIILSPLFLPIIQPGFCVATKGMFAAEIQGLVGLIIFDSLSGTIYNSAFGLYYTPPFPVLLITKQAGEVLSSMLTSQTLQVRILGTGLLDQNEADALRSIVRSGLLASTSIYYQYVGAVLPIPQIISQSALDPCIYRTYGITTLTIDAELYCIIINICIAPT
jgi:hypothetical protein